MIKNLEDINSTSLEGIYDVLIIGAGTVGLLISHRLSQMGKKIICLESGSYYQQNENHDLNTTEHIGDYYSGADSGRFRCLGGTSTRWGGALIPFQKEDLATSDWPIDWNELELYTNEIEEIFDLPKGSYIDESVGDGTNYIARLAKWPTFKKRNIYTLLKNKIRADDVLEIWINATATEFDIKKDEISTVSAKSKNGNSITVKSHKVILAAGAIETTRLLHLIDQQNNNIITNATNLLGVGFHDHLSAVVAELEPINRKKLNEIVGFRFDKKGSMRNLRFELAPDTNIRHTIPPHFVHISFSQDGGVFSTLRNIFQTLQKGSLPSLSLLLALLNDVPWLIKAICWKFFKKRLLYPDSAKILLNVVIEQPCLNHNTITLSKSKTDCFGVPLATISWHITEIEERIMQETAKVFCSYWENSYLNDYARLHIHSDKSINQDMVSGGGIYHPGGTTRIGVNAEHGVVDKNLRVFGTDNLYVLSTSIFPSGGGANPTMTLLHFALYCCDHLFDN